MAGRIRHFSLASAVKHLIGAVLVLVACGLYVFGTWGPAIAIRAAGSEFLAKPTERQVFSMIGLLRLLYTERNYVPFFCTVVFSFVLPVIKFILITLTLVVATCCRRFTWSSWLPLKVVRVLRVVCKYQLVDAFSVILLVTNINFVGLSAEPLPAAHAYLVYGLLSITTTQWLCHCYSETYRRSLEEYGEESGSSQMSSPLLSSHLQPCQEDVDDVDGSRLSPSAYSEISTSLSVMTASLYNGSRGLSNMIVVEKQDVSSRVTRRLPMQKNGPSFYRPLHPLNHQGKEYGSSVGESQDFDSPIAMVPVSFPNAERRGSDISLSGRAATADCVKRRHFSEYMTRLCLLVLLFCVSAFSLVVCWVRPILTVTLVPGRVRGFAIETSTRSLGDVFRRLYDMGHVLSGCGMMFVFPIFLTFVVYLASVGALVTLCILERPEKADDDTDLSSYGLLCDDGGVPTSVRAWNRQRVLIWSKVFARVARFAGDLAMPDVQSFGLLTSFFIVNNIDFFGARLPAAPTGEPSTFVDRLLWNFSGFLALLAFGISATQVQRLVPPMPEVLGESTDSGRPTRQRGGTSGSSGPKLRPAVPANTGSMRRRYDGSGSTWEYTSPSGLTRRTVSYGQSLQRSAAQAAESSKPVLCRARSTKYSLLFILLQGGFRLALALALLLPVWLRPVGIVDVDIHKVNLQLQFLVEYVNPALEKVLPHSVGECLAEEHNAPTPCVGSKPLDVIRTEEYEAHARWATGLQTAQLQTVRFDILENGRIVLTVSGYIHKLALSLRIGQCITGNPEAECPVLWDNEDSCCSDNTAFTLQVEVECQSTFPYLREATLLRPRISSLVIVENVLGIFPIEVADITEAVEDLLSETVKVYLDPANKWIHWNNDEPMSFIQLLNRILAINAPEGLVCPHSVQDAPHS